VAVGYLELELEFNTLSTGYETVETVPVVSATEPSISLFLSFMPTKDLAPFSTHTPQNPLG